MAESTEAIRMPKELIPYCKQIRAEYKRRVAQSRKVISAQVIQEFEGGQEDDLS